MNEAKELGVERLFVLTYRNDFFGRFGFEEVEKTELPQKIWTDCVKCPRFPLCDEVAMVTRARGEAKLCRGGRRRLYHGY